LFIVGDAATLERALARRTLASPAAGGGGGGAAAAESIWRPALSYLREQSLLGDALPLCCPHCARQLLVRQAGDFALFDHVCNSTPHAQ
jgi:hypothetical protein